MRPRYTTGAKNGLQLKDLRGLSYDDPKWDQLLDQMTLDDMNALISLGGYQTNSVESIGKVRTSAHGIGLGVNYRMGVPVDADNILTGVQHVTQEMGPISESNGTIAFDVTVTNTGSVAGKDVVEVYFNPPYTNTTCSPRRCLPRS